MTLGGITALYRVGIAAAALTAAAAGHAQSIEFVDGMTFVGLSGDGNTVVGQSFGQASYWTKAGGVKTIPVLGSSSIAKFCSIDGKQIVGEVSTASGKGVFWFNGTTVDVLAPTDSKGDYTVFGCDGTGDRVYVGRSRGGFVITRTSSVQVNGGSGMAPDGSLYGEESDFDDYAFTNAVWWDTNGFKNVVAHGSGFAAMGRIEHGYFTCVGLTANHKWFAAGSEYLEYEKEPGPQYDRAVMKTNGRFWETGSYGSPVGSPTFPSGDGNGVFFGASGDYFLQDVHDPLNHFYNVVGPQLSGFDINTYDGMSQDGLVFIGTATNSTGKHSFYMQLASTIGSSSYHLVPYQHNVITSPGVLKTPIGWPASAVLATQPAHGTVTVNSDGGFDYMPSGNFVGRDTFQVRNGAGTQLGKPGTVVLHVGVPSSLRLTSSSVYGAAGTAVRGNVTLNFTAKSRITLNLKSTHPEAASVPSTVVVPVGSSSVTFPITTHATDSDVTTTLVATLDTVSVTAGLTIKRNVPATLSVPQILGSNTAGVTGHIYLTGPAGPAGVHVLLKVLNGVLTVPSSVNVAPGETSASVPIGVQANVSRIVGITANGKLFPVNVIGLVRASSGNLFSPKSLTVSRPPTFSTTLRTTVCWFNGDSIPHSVTSDKSFGPNSDSVYPDGIPPGKYYYYTVDPAIPAGTNIFYHCKFKGAAGDGSHVGAGMAGCLTVK